MWTRRRVIYKIHSGLGIEPRVQPLPEWHTGSPPPPDQTRGQPLITRRQKVMMCLVCITIETEGWCVFFICVWLCVCIWCICDVYDICTWCISFLQERKPLKSIKKVYLWCIRDVCVYLYLICVWLFITRRQSNDVPPLSHSRLDPAKIPTTNGSQVCVWGGEGKEGGRLVQAHLLELVPPRHLPKQTSKKLSTTDAFLPLYQQVVCTRGTQGRTFPPSSWSPSGEAHF